MKTSAWPLPLQNDSCLTVNCRAGTLPASWGSKGLKVLSLQGNLMYGPIPQEYSG